MHVCHDKLTRSAFLQDKLSRLAVISQLRICNLCIYVASMASSWLAVLSSISNWWRHVSWHPDLNHLFQFRNACIYYVSGVIWPEQQFIGLLLFGKALVEFACYYYPTCGSIHVILFTWRCFVSILTIQDHRCQTHSTEDCV